MLDTGPGTLHPRGQLEADLVFRAKGEIALAGLDQVLAASVRFDVVLAGAGCGASAEFRHGLKQRQLRWAEQPKVPAARLLVGLRRGGHPTQSESLRRGRATSVASGAQAPPSAG